MAAESAVQYMQLGGAGIWTVDLRITRQPALPTEPQPSFLTNRAFNLCHVKDSMLTLVGVFIKEVTQWFWPKTRCFPNPNQKMWPYNERSGKRHPSCCFGNACSRPVHLFRYEDVSPFYFIFSCSYLLQLFSRILQPRFAARLQKCFVNYENYAPNFHTAWGWLDNVRTLIFRGEPIL